jgi:hypothetical protein
MKGLRVDPVERLRHTLGEASTDLGRRIPAESHHEDARCRLRRNEVGSLLDEDTSLAGPRAGDDGAVPGILDCRSLFSVEKHGVRAR